MSERVGQQIGHYRIVRLLGSGGFANVYLGEHIYLHTQAAIKMLQTRLTEDDLAFFLTEARTIANLTHPHIVQVLDFGVEEQTPFLVMTYAANGSLRQRYPSGTRVALAEVVNYVTQIAEALQYAHARRLVHRDVKPENMLMGQDGKILLSDFGIAVASQDTHQRERQKVRGTAAYMAPEQLQGKAGTASDQYALGIVVYEWLTGQQPFQGSFIEISNQHLCTPPPPLREKAPYLPSLVEDVVATALSKDPDDRFPTIRAFAYALSRCVDESSSTPFVSISSDEQDPVTPASSPFSTEVSAESESLLPAEQSGEQDTPLLPQRRWAAAIWENRWHRFAIVGLLLLLLVASSVSAISLLMRHSSGTQTTGISQGKNVDHTPAGPTTPGSGTSVPGQTPVPGGTPIPTRNHPSATATATAPGAESSPTPSPTATASGPVTIPENLQLTCVTGCNVAIAVTLDTVEINRQTSATVFNFTVQNEGQGACPGMHASTLYLQGSSGQQFQGGPPGGFTTAQTLPKNETVTEYSTFAFTPASGITYTLNSGVSCNSGTETFQAETLTF